MAFKIQISLRAQIEIERASDFYVKNSVKAPLWFLESLQKSYKTLSLNPYFEIRYRNVRAYKIKRFPFTLYFTIDEKNKAIRILSCFHNARKR